MAEPRFYLNAWMDREAALASAAELRDRDEVTAAVVIANDAVVNDDGTHPFGVLYVATVAIHLGHTAEDWQATARGWRDRA